MTDGGFYRDIKPSLLVDILPLLDMQTAAAGGGGAGGGGGGGGSSTRGNHELWEEHVPTPRRRDTNSPPLRKERALFGPLSDLQAPRPVRHSLLLREVRPRPPPLTSVMLERRSSWHSGGI